MKFRAFTALTLLTASVALAEVFPLTENSWSNPEFVERFRGTFTLSNELMPNISPSEKNTFDEVTAFLTAENYPAAIAALRGYVTAETSAALDYILANLYYQNENYEEAARYYEIAIKKFPNFYLAYLNYGRSLVQKGDYVAALPMLQKAVEIKPGDGSLYGLLAFCYLNQDLYTTALDAYRLAIILQPNSRDWKIGKIQCLMALEDYEEAIPMLYELIQADPDNVDYWKLQTNAFNNTEQTALAAANLEIVRAMGKATPESLAQLGDIYLNEGLGPQAISVYREAMASGRLRLAVALRAVNFLVTSSQYEQARDMAAAVRSAYPQITGEDNVTLLTMESTIAGGLGDTEGAIRDLLAVVKEDPMNGRALITLSKLYRRSDDSAKAVFYAEEAVKIPATAREGLLELAQLHVGQKNYREAVKHLRAALEIRHEDYIAEYMNRVEQAASRLN